MSGVGGGAPNPRPRPMQIALAQINPTIGDLAGNVAKILSYAHCAAAEGADLVVFSELCVSGYPPMDLLDHVGFVRDCEAAVRHLARELKSSAAVIVGAPMWTDEAVGKRLRNAALVLDGGEVQACVGKTLLPTYDVFDEYRYFEPAERRQGVEVRGVKLGLHVCEDVWNNEDHAEVHLYRANPIDELAELGAELFVNISASPFALGKRMERDRAVGDSAKEHRLPFVYVNQVGANTEIVFDGDSRVHAPDGSVAMRLPSFREALGFWRFEKGGKATGGIGPIYAPQGDAFSQQATGSQNGQQEAVDAYDPIADLHDALVLGVRDYFQKTGFFEKALVGLSGGIDSAVTCALAVEALGPDRVMGITMPSKYSSEGSVSDSEALAQNLGIGFHEVAIEPAVSAFEEMLALLFDGTEPGVAEENVQARTRGVTLMAVSNKFGHLLLTTGNKSEMAVGYATLYGDMSGGLAVLSDVFKLEVYRLARYINDRAGRALIPESTITKPPSAELRPDQQDSDSLPPYEVLDAILKQYVEEVRGPEEIARLTGYDRALVDKIVGMVDRNEYKRRQAAPGLRVTTKAFGVGRRLPIVMRRTRVEPQEVSGDA